MSLDYPFEAATEALYQLKIKELKDDLLIKQLRIDELNENLIKATESNNLLLHAIDELSKSGEHGENCGVLKSHLPGGIGNPANCNCWKRFLRQAEAL